MKLLDVFACLSDATRLRLVHLLLSGPLCVCHFQTILREPQVKISKHLGFLKRHGLVAAEHCGQWRVYRLAESLSPAVEQILAALGPSAADERTLRDDAVRLARLRTRLPAATPDAVLHACSC